MDTEIQKVKFVEKDHDKIQPGLAVKWHFFG